jgi:TonB family protein
MTETRTNHEGQVVDGKYPLRKYLGGGEQSAVFLTDFGSPESQKAAIKFIPAQAPAAEQLSRWQAATRLSHPALLRLFDMGECELDAEPLLYVVMEYAEENLAEVIPERSLTAEEVGGMLEPALGALSYLHGMGFVHGHLKPSNIMAVDDQVKISADGLSRAEEPAQPAPRTAYDPPEREAKGPSPAGDVWSLGVTLIEAMTQRPPAWNSAGEVVVPPEMPPVYADIVHNCLKRDPARRWPVAQVAARLRGVLVEPIEEKPAATGPAVAQPAAAPAEAVDAAVKAGETSKRRLGVPLGAIALLIAAAVLLGPKLFNRRPASEPPPSAPIQTPPVQSAPVTEPPAQTPPPQTAPQPARAAKPTAPVKGAVLHQVLPDVPGKARNTIRGTVRVGITVQVNSSGDVTGARVDSRGPSSYFSKLALESARQWKFRPPTVSGQDFASTWRLRFEFTRATTRASAAPINQ